MEIITTQQGVCRIQIECVFVFVQWCALKDKDIVKLYLIPITHWSVTPPTTPAQLRLFILTIRFFTDIGSTVLTWLVVTGLITNHSYYFISIPPMFPFDPDSITIHFIHPQWFAKSGTSFRYSGSNLYANIIPYTILPWSLSMSVIIKIILLSCLCLYNSVPHIASIPVLFIFTCLEIYYLPHPNRTHFRHWFSPSQEFKRRYTRGGVGWDRKSVV